ncbi:lysyl-tRNA synthetase [Vibrio cholerae]|nr:lysyl-tRNA synthetase [Vibrio cholerae]HAS7948202.1 lysyl-tRNA synthetase [Vibrio cholerae]
MLDSRRALGAERIHDKCCYPLRVLRLPNGLGRTKGVFSGAIRKRIISLKGTLEQSSELLRVLKQPWICSSIRTVSDEPNVRSSPCGAELPP